MSLIFLTPLAAILLGLVLGTALWFRGWRKAARFALALLLFLLAFAGLARAVGPTCPPKCSAPTRPGTQSPFPDPCHSCCRTFSSWYCWLAFLGSCECEGEEEQ